MNNKLWLNCLAMIALLPLFAHAQCYNNNNTLTNVVCVTGEAEIKVAPDEVQLILGVETSDKVLKISKSLNDERVRKALAVTKDYGLPPQAVQTEFISINTDYFHNRPATEGILYLARKTIVIRLTDITKFEGLLSDLLDAGITHVHGVEFRTTQLKKYRDEARAKAVIAAQDKAEALAKSAGRKIGKAQIINEISWNYWGGYSSWWGGRWTGGQSQSSSQAGGGSPLSDDSAIALGQISIRASISVTYALE